MNELFSRFFGPLRGRDSSRWAVHPALNLWEDADNLYAEAELPGLELNDLEVYVTGNQLTIKGERKPPVDEKAAWHRQERGYGGFSRKLDLPQGVDEQKVNASLKNGVLTVQLPKSAAAKARRITIASK
jgi:HSP20 family protein